MNKKALLISLAGLSVVLSGCTFPGAQDEAALQQTRMLEQMQQQISTLLSGIDTLRLQNEQLSGRLAEMYYTQQDIPLSPIAQKKTEEVTSLFASGFDIEKDFPSSGKGLSELTIPNPEDIKAMMPTPEQINAIATGDEFQKAIASAKASTGGSILDELKKASKENKLTTSGEQNKASTGNKW